MVPPDNIARNTMTMSCFDLDSNRGLVVFTFSMLPPSQVWSVRCRHGSNCESRFDSCSVGIDSSCTCGTVRPCSHPCVFSLNPHMSRRHCTNLNLQFIMVGSVLHRATSSTPLSFTLNQYFMSTFTPSKIYSCPHWHGTRPCVGTRYIVDWSLPVSNLIAHCSSRCAVKCSRESSGLGTLRYTCVCSGQLSNSVRVSGSESLLSAALYHIRRDSFP